MKTNSIFSSLPTGAAPSLLHSEHWTPLGYFAAYRLILAGLLVVLNLLGQTPAPFGSLAPSLYNNVIHIHFVITLLTALATYARLLPFNPLVDIHVFTDIAGVILLMHASGGLDSGLGMLLIVSVAAAGIFSIGRTAILFAALASLAVLLEQSFLYMQAPYLIQTSPSYPQAGMLGVALFATAALVHTLAQRIRASEHLARQRGLDLANMAQLTDYVIQHMQTGVLVIDANDQIRLINTTARQLLGVGSRVVVGKLLQGELPALQKQLQAWRESRQMNSRFLELADNQQQLVSSFMVIGQNAGHLIFLEDASEANQQAQQLKLASLGRLTASIAHEIRNPLGAISHASELLGESPLLEKSDKRLLSIILEQSKRINALIESVLQLGRRERPQPQDIVLGLWLHRFLEEFEHHANCQPGDIYLNLGKIPITVQFDPMQLQQIIWNLCLNGLRHACNASTPKLELSIGHNEKDVWLDVRDHGPGIPAEVAEHLFEPFFTTADKGTGLGLYLAHELAESNRARLLYLPPPDGGARFRLLFGR